MYSDITRILTDLVNRTLPLGQIHFSALAEQHPRTSPCLVITLAPPCEAIFSSFGHITLPPPNALSIHFGKQQLTLDLQRDNALLQQLQVPRRGPRTGAFLLQALTELQMQPDEQDTAMLVVLSLLSHCRDLLGSDIHTANRSRALFEAVRSYIEENYASSLTRESVAQAFYISPNYLSHLF
ncbi:AraC family transcriptional regulator, partial [Enterobacter hormaechei]